MKIAICIKKDLVGNRVLNRLASGLAGHQILAILCDRVSDAERAATQATDFVFYERDLVIDHLFPAIDRTAYKADPGRRMLSFGQLARQQVLEVFDGGDINSGETFDRLADFAPDYTVSVRYNYIFREPAIRLARCAVLNVHPGLLPGFAGVYPSFRALQQECPEFGATLHLIEDARIDHGPVLARRSMPVDRQRSALWHIIEAYRVGADLLLDYLAAAEDGGAQAGIAQDARERRYFGYPTQEEFHELIARGIRLVDHDEYLEWLDEYR